MEQKRGCGWRKIGGLYLAGEGMAVACRLLPYELHDCPCCGAGVKFSRSFQWLEARYFIDNVNIETAAGGKCGECKIAPCDLLRSIENGRRFGLMWVGGAHYTPSSFIEEAEKMGVSKRIAAIPKELELGETWVLLAHKQAAKKKCETCDGSGFSEEHWKGIIGAKCEDCEGEGSLPSPAIFYAFRPTRIEKIVTEDMLTDEERERLKKRGITPVIVPDEPKHRGTKPEKEEERLL